MSAGLRQLAETTSMFNSHINFDTVMSYISKTLPMAIEYATNIENNVNLNAA